jgi:hypothetical protein
MIALSAFETNTSRGTGEHKQALINEDASVSSMSRIRKDLEPNDDALVLPNGSG